MFEPGFHIHDHRVVAEYQHLFHNTFQHNTFGAHTPAAAGLDASHEYQSHTVVDARVLVRQIVNFRVHLEYGAVSRLGTRSLLYDLFQVRKRHYLTRQLLRETERRRQVCVRIGVYSQDIAASFGEQPRHHAGKRRLAGATFSTNRDLHRIRILMESGVLRIGRHAE